MEVYLSWLQGHSLAIVAIISTLIFIYHYVIEKDSGIQLSKKYRNSIFEAQSKIFLNATQYLIVGNKDMAIREFLNAVDINRETIETYFALGGLFRSNGEIEKAISIHRSLIARDNISEAVRLKALKELAVDFDKGGFLDKAISTYEDVLKINRDETDVLLALCRIHEDISDWDQAFNYRRILSKVSREDQSETVSHILVEKAKQFLDVGDAASCKDALEEALKYSPSVSAKILQLRLNLLTGNIEQSKVLLLELLKEHPMYASFIFVSLEIPFKHDDEVTKSYWNRLDVVKGFFLDINDDELLKSPSVVLSRIRMLKNYNRYDDAFSIINKWVKNGQEFNEVLKIEYIKLLIEIGKVEEAVQQTSKLLENLNKTLTRHFCNQCGFNSDDIFWRCPQCHEWETIQFRWKV